VRQEQQFWTQQGISGVPAVVFFWPPAFADRRAGVDNYSTLNQLKSAQLI
jgi:predicted DsbA family dithiol-disulfide isomerase